MADNFKYKFPGYLSNNESVTSAKLNSIISAINTLIENLMNHDHIGITNAYNETTRGPKLIGDACLVEKTITTRCLNDNAVVTVKIADQNVTTDKIKDLNVTTDKINNDAITTIKILDKNVTREKLADNAIDFSKIDSNTLDSIYNTMFDMMYPVGSSYITTLSYCPLQKGRWELITTAQSRVLQVASSPDKAGTTIEAGLPNIKGTFTAQINVSNTPIPSAGNWNGAFQRDSNTYGKVDSGTSNGSWHNKILFDASHSNSIYKDSCNTVQPPAFLINIFKRVE